MKNKNSSNSARTARGHSRSAVTVAETRLKRVDSDQASRIGGPAGEPERIAERVVRRPPHAARRQAGGALVDLADEVGVGGLARGDALVRGTDAVLSAVGRSCGSTRSGCSRSATSRTGSAWHA